MKQCLSREEKPGTQHRTSSNLTSRLFSLAILRPLYPRTILPTVRRASSYSLMRRPVPSSTTMSSVSPSSFTISRMCLYLVGRGTAGESGQVGARTYERRSIEPHHTCESRRYIAISIYCACRLFYLSRSWGTRGNSIYPYRSVTTGPTAHMLDKLN